jgi:hypothetical protein
MRSSVAVSLGLVGSLVLAAGCAQKGANCDALDNCMALEAGTDDFNDGLDESWGDPPLTANKDVDILFVIDNSGSMGEEQALLAANVGAFINVLEQDGVDANYRIGITTTDNGNPWCPSGSTTPEAGQLVLSSCKDRINDFLFGNDVDVRDLACNDICTLDDPALEILPTTTDVDSDPKPRPWLERIEGKKNIPESTDTAAAFACFGPQGINGCGFESQLESMYLALVRTETANEASYGFMRPSAILAVVFVTDEADCSYDSEWAEIFDAEGSKVFWSDPAAAFPTSAVCWNAGVECYGDPSGYDSCDPVDKDVFGNVTENSPQAVLHPMKRYIDLLNEIEYDKQSLNPSQEVIVALIGGVDATGQPVYAVGDDIDPVFLDDFGIGPGCEAPNPLNPDQPIRAVPPVRLRELTEEFTPDNMFSVCEPDYSPALAAIADRIKDQIKPACYRKCAADTNPGTELVEPECTIEQQPPGLDDSSTIEECLRDANGYVIDPETGDYAMPDDATNVCHAILVDKSGQTADPYDDMAPECIDLNSNVQFELVRRPGFPGVSGTAVTATCELADFPDVACPGIGG